MLVPRNIGLSGFISLSLFIGCALVAGDEPAAKRATPGLPFNEDFTTTDLRDAAETTALWENGSLTLPPMEARYTNLIEGGTSSVLNIGGFSRAGVVADVNNDGHPDIIVGNSGSFNVVLTNNGSGGFTQSASFGSTGDVRGIAAADVNGDGYVDVVETGFMGVVNLYLHNGTNLPYGVPIEVLSQITIGVVLEDFNGDGLPDLVVGGNTSTSSFFINNGTNNPFDTPITLPGSGTYTSARAADANGDGLMDLWMGNWAGPNLLWLNDGTAGVFGTSAQITADANTTHTLLPYDLDGDGDLDALVANWNAVARAYYNDGTGAFSAGVDYMSDALNSWGAAIFDADGDGDGDLFMGVNSAVNRVYPKTGASPPYAGRDLDDTTSSAQALLANDFNGDKRPDLAMLNGQASFTENNRIMFQAELHPYTDSQTVAFNRPGVGATYGDVDGDGDEDLIVLANGGNDTVYFNDPVNPFATSYLLPSTDLGRKSKLGDINNDGKLDLVVAADTNHFYLNDYNGSNYPFNSFTLFGTPHIATWDIALSDFDGDGFLDVITAKHQSTNSIFWGDGSGFPVETTIDPSNEFTYGVSVGDLNGDGLLDFVLSNYIAPDRVYLNNGNRTFSISFLYDSSHTYSRDNKIADLDGDGDFDVIVSCNGYNRLFLNTGSGTFSAPILLSNTDDSQGVEVGDLNRDGHLDLFFSSTSTDYVILNNGTNIPFSGVPPIPLINDGFSYGGTLFDYNRDGALDLVSSNHHLPDRIYTNATQSVNLIGRQDTMFGISGTITGPLTEHDINRDGFLDLIARTDEGFNLHLNSGTDTPLGVPTQVNSLLSPSNARGMVTGDVNRDGLVDVILFYNGSPLEIYLHNGTSTPYSSTPLTLGNAAAYRTGTLADIDGDGDMDLVATVDGSDVLLFDNIRNSPNPFTTGVSLVSNSSIITDVQLGDVTLDGAVEMVLTYSSGSTELHINLTGVSAFLTLNTSGSGGFTRLADVDYDGDVDVVCFYSSAHAPEIFLNNDTGTPFLGVSPIQIGSNGTLTGGGLWDLNHDGQVDILINRGTVTEIAYNQGDGTFAEPTALVSGVTTPTALAAGDFNRDGRLELATAQIGVASMYWHNWTGGVDVHGNCAQSLEVDTETDPITGIRLTSTGTGKAKFEVTNNGGTNWYPIAQNRELLFPTSGNDLRWRATLDAPSSGSLPTLDSVTLDVPPTSPADSTAEIPAGTVGQETVVTIQARSASGFPRSTGGDFVAVTLSSTAGNEAAAQTLTDNNNGTYSFAYTPIAHGTDTFSITMNGQSINCTPCESTVNALPQGADFTLFASLNTTLQVDLNNYMFDPDGSLVMNTFQLEPAPVPAGSVSMISDLLTYNAGGTPVVDSFAFTLEDNLGAASAPITVTVHVSAGPTALDDTFTVLDSAVTTLLPLNNDGSGLGIDPTSIVSTDPINGGTVEPTQGVPGSLTYTPPANAIVSDSFTYTVRDVSNQESNVATVTLNMVDSPVAGTVAEVFQRNETRAIDLLSAVTAGTFPLDPTTLFIHDQIPDLGDITDNGDGTITYAASFGATGTDTITYSFRDTEGNRSNQAMLTVRINAPPVAIPDEFPVYEGTGNILDVLANDFDPEGDEWATLTILTEPQHGSYTVDGLTLTLIPETGYLGTDSFSYQVTEAEGGQSNIVNVTVNVYAHVPDANFKACLLADFDTNMDGELDDTEILAATPNISCITSNIADLDGLNLFLNQTNVNLHDNLITQVPDLLNMTQLEVLDLTNNQLLEIPPILPTDDPSTDPRLPISLVRVELAFNFIDQQPNLIGACNLEAIGLCHNDLETLALNRFPACTGKRANSVRTVDVSDNCIHVPPDFCGMTGFSDHALTSLERVNLTNNVVSVMDPDFLPPSLQELLLEGNVIADQPDLSGAAHSNIGLLTLEDNPLAEFFTSRLPGSIQALAAGALGMGTFPNFNAVPKRSGNFKALTTLNLSNNGFTSLPPANLPVNVEVLILADNDISTFPDLSATVITHLDLSNNQLTSINPAFLPPTLLHLDVSGNMIAALPLHVAGSFPSLTTLDISNNGLNSLDASLLPVTLVNLDVSDNDLTVQPDTSGMTALEQVDISGNEIASINVNLLPTTTLVLNLAGNDLATQPDLSAFTNLDTLDLSENLITAIDTSTLPAGLRVLQANNNGITALSGLSAIAALEELSLNNNSLSTWPTLTDLPLLTALDLSFNGLTALPVSTLPASLQKLRLGGNSLTTTPDLSALVSLQTLDLSHTGISQLPDLTGATDLNWCDVSGNQLVNLDAASGFAFPRNMGTLIASNNQLMSINGLVDVRGMTILDLSSNQLTTLENGDSENQLPPFLTDLNASGNQLMDLPGLSAFSNLRRIDVGNNQILELPTDMGLPDLPAVLESLEVGNNDLMGLPDLSGMLGMSLLDISHNDIPNLDAAFLPPNLVVFKANGNPLGVAPNLSGFSELLHVDLSSSQLMSFAANLLPVTLQTLSLGGNDMELPDLSTLTALLHLDFSHSSLEDFNPAFLPMEIQSLDFSFNDLTVVPDLSGLSSLTALYLANNNITELLGLPTSLIILDLSNNELESFELLATLVNLQWLNISGNEMTNLPDLSALTQLQFFDLSGNEISDLSILPVGLAQVVFNDNPIDPTTIPPLPGLTSLDLRDAGISELPDLTPFVQLAFLDVSGNALVNIDGLSANAFLGSEPGHQVHIHNNFLDPDEACAEITAMETRTSESGAAFTYAAQGNITAIFVDFPDWGEPTQTKNILDWAYDVSEGTYFFDLNCNL